MKNDDNSSHAEKPGKKPRKKETKRYGLVFEMSLDVKAASKKEAVTIARQWLMDTILKTPWPDEVSAFPPQIQPGTEDTEETPSLSQEALPADTGASDEKPKRKAKKA